jgi:eukaryotic-like serine/threonine-protein kinase
MLLRFGPYELDQASFELRRSTRRVRLAARPMELLLLLVKRRGELVTREEIARSLWPGMDFEDLDARINTAIAQIRYALIEEAAKPRYLETVIGKGYRFIGAVETITIAEAVSAGSAAVQDHAGGGRPTPKGTSSAAFLPEENLQESPKRPETGSRNFKLPQPNSELSVRAGTDLTDRAAAKIRWGAWGTGHLWTAALVTLTGLAVAAGIVVVKHNHEKTSATNPIQWTTTQITTNDSDDPVDASAISPDGHLLAYADKTGIFVREMLTGRTRLLKAPRLRASKLVWFSDQAHLLLTGFDLATPKVETAQAQVALPQIWFLSANDGKPRLLRKDADYGSPSPDGRSVAFTVDDGREIRLSNADGDDERSVVRGDEHTRFAALFWSVSGKRISYQQQKLAGHGGTEIESNYEWSFCSRDIQTGQQTALVKDLPFDSAQETMDGRIFYMRSLPPNDNDHNGIWVVAANAATGEFVNSPKRIYAFHDIVSTGMSVTADGKEITAVRQGWQPDIYVSDLSYPGPALKNVRRLTTDTRSDFPNSFNPAGDTVYFESSRVEPVFHIFRQRIDSPNAELLTIGGGGQFFPTLMADGKTLLYEVREKLKDGHLDRSIYRANADGSDARLVWKEAALDEWRCPLLASGNCVLRETDGHLQFVFYDLNPVSGKGKVLARSSYTPTIMGDWTLSPDDKFAAIPIHDLRAPSIRLIGLEGASPEREIKVHEASQLWGIHWAADGKGFYAEMRTAAEHRLQYIGLSGDVHTLREANGNTWGVPSRDDKRLAFVDSTMDRNVFEWH